MRRYAGLAIITGAIMACAAGDSHGPMLTPEHSAAIRDSVRTMLATFQRYSATRRWDSVATLYVGDSALRWIENGRLVMRSSAALEKGLGALPPTTSIETTYDTLEITPVAPGVASVLTYYHTTFKDSALG